MKAKVMSFFILLSLLITGLAFSLWLDQPVENQFGEVVAMSSESSPLTVTTVFASSGKSLVPEGAILGQNDVTTLEYTYVISANEGEVLDLAVNEVVFLKDNQEFADEFDLLVIEYNFEAVSSNEILLNVSMSLNMPENETQYNSIAGSALSFYITLDRIY